MNFYKKIYFRYVKDLKKNFIFKKDDFLKKLH